MSNTATSNLVIQITADAQKAITTMRNMGQKVAGIAAETAKNAQGIELSAAEKALAAKKRLLVNQKEWEYRNNLATGTQLKAALQDQQASYQQFGTQWTTISRRIARIDADIQRQRVAAQKQADQAILAAQKQAAQAQAATNQQAAQAATAQTRAQAASARAAAKNSVQGQQAAQKRGAAVSQIGDGLAYGGVAVLGGLGVATKEAVGYDQALRNVDSIAHLTTAQFEDMRKAVLDISKDPSIRQTPEDLAKGLYDVYSSGFSGAKALDILKVSAEGASAGMSDTSTSSRVLMAVLNSGISGVTSTKQAMDVLFQTVNLGVVNFSELADSIGPILPIAKTAGVSLQEVAAAMAALTLQGIKADEAATEIKGVIEKLIHPSEGAAKAMDKLGIVHGITAVRAEGLKGALLNVVEATKKHQDALPALFPEIRSFIGLQALASDGAKKYSETLNSMTHASDGAGQMQEALARQNQGAGAQMEALQKDASRVGIEIGTVLLPIFRDMLKTVESAVKSYESMSHAAQSMTVRLLAFGAAGTVALVGIVKLITGIKEAIALFGLFQGAAVAAGGAQAAAAAGGATAFAVAAPWAVAILAAIALIVLLKVKFDEAAEAQDKLAKKKLALKNFTDTGDTTKNISNQISLNQTETALEKKQLAALKKDPFSYVGPGGVVKTTQIGGRGGMNVAQAEARNQADIKAREDHIAGMEASTRALALDRDTTSSLSNTRRNLEGSIGKSKKSEDDIAKELVDLKNRIATTRPGRGGSALPAGMNMTQANARVDKLTSDLAALRSDRAKNEKSLIKAKHEENLANQEGTADSGIGMQIANEALRRQKVDSKKFVHHCQELARTTVQDVTHAFDGIWDRSKDASAKTNLARFQKAGLARRYTPGQKLAPGTLLYSTTMGGDSGHVQTIGPQGQRLDQYGSNHFDEKNFQWFVAPPAGGRAVAPLAADAAGASGGSSTSDKAAEKIADQRANARTIYANAAVADAKSAFDAMLAALKDKGAGMTPAERAKLVASLKVQAGKIRSLLDKSANSSLAQDPTNPAAIAQNSVDHKQNQRDYIDMVKTAGDAGQDAADKAAKAHEELERKRRSSERARLEAVKRVQEFDLRGLEIGKDAAQTDQERADANDRIAAQKGLIALTDKHIGANSDDEQARTAAATIYAAALRDINAAHTQEGVELTKNGRQREIDLLRAQADATGDLVGKDVLLSRAEAAALAIASPDDLPILNSQFDESRRQRGIGIGEDSARSDLHNAVNGKAGAFNSYRSTSNSTDSLRDPKDLAFSAASKINEILGAVDEAKARNPRKPGIALSDVMPYIKELLKKAAIDGEAGDQANQSLKDYKSQHDDWGNYRRQMTDSLSQSADAAGKDFISRLLDGKNSKGAWKDFWGSMQQMGKQALVNTFYDRVVKKAFDSIFDSIGDQLGSALKGGGSQLIKAGLQFALIVGAVMNLSGKNGKKKQRNSIFGAVLGGVAGSFFGSAGVGAEIGANLGGMFAAGGRPPVGKWSLVGESGPELVRFDSPGTVIPNHKIGPMMSPAPWSGSARRSSTSSAAAGAGGTNVNVTSHHYGDIKNGTDISMINDNLVETLARKIRL